MLTIRRDRAHPDIETATLAAIHKAARAARIAAEADRRAQRRFGAMIDAHDFHGRPARLYAQSERWLDALAGEMLR